MRSWPTLLVFSGAAAMILAGGLADGTPLYSARAGRTCDNCHVTPNDWKNPALRLRKCTLSCQSCHVDPAGGGLRNASGRFYGRATLPLVATSPRPTADWDRRFFGLVPRWDRATTYTHDIPRGPATRSESAGPEYEPRDFWARGKAAGGVPAEALFQGRYGALRADPMIRIGWDVRAAALFARRGQVFPMQADLGVQFHPVEHLSLVANTGARGRTRGLDAVVDDARTPYLREGFVLVHEAPYMAYLKAGRFVPSFGLRLDDHTSFIRRGFELDSALPETRVTGVEIGAAPNYPFFSASWFKSRARDVAPAAFDIFDVDESRGTALNAGYRHMGWSVGGSIMDRRRPLAEGGDATSYGFYATINPWFYSRKIPLTYQLEFDRGRFARDSGSRATRQAFYHEVAWLAGNGLNLLLKHDWEDPDRRVKDDEAHRVAAGAQLTPVPGVTLDGRVRVLFPAGGDAGADLFLQLHLWN